jgi:tetratricopeptide (TPR) repeat protein
VQAYPEPLTRRTARWARRHRALVGGVGAVLLTVCLALGAGLFLIGRERNEAVAARQQADVNAEMAATQRQLALDTLGLLITNVQEQLEDTPGNHRLKEDLLATALAGLGKLAGSAEKSQDKSLRMIDAHHRMGDIFLVLGRHAKARQQFERARDLAKELCGVNPANADARFEHVRALRQLADVSELSGSSERARAQYRKVLEQLRPLRTAHPKDARLLMEEVRAHSMLGEIGRFLGASKEASEHYHQALRLSEQALAANTAVAQARIEIALAQGGLAETTLHRGDVIAAARWARKGQAILAPLRARGVRKNHVLHGLGLCELVLAEALWKAGRAAEARALYARSFKAGEAAAAADPRNAHKQRSLSVLHNRLGDVALDLGAVDEALKHYRASAAVMEKLVRALDQRMHAEHDLALAYLRLGNASMQAGKPAEAWTYLRKCPALLKPLMDADPKHAEVQRDLGIVYEFMGMLSLRGTDEPRPATTSGSPSAWPSSACGSTRAPPATAAT